jgi:proteasome lid subunit RPN8/RPN11
MALAAEDAQEICGLLLGRDPVIGDIRPAANVAPDPFRHFEIDPAVLIAAHRDARSGGLPVMGHYHSHPSGRVEPSATDAASANPDGSLWLIVASGSATLWRAEQGGAGQVQFVPIRLDAL